MGAYFFVGCGEFFWLEGDVVCVAGFGWELGEDVGFGASDPCVVGESHVEVWEGFGVWNVVAEVVLFAVGVGEVVGEVVGGFG